jgi:hypothetical protein
MLQQLKQRRYDCDAGAAIRWLLQNTRRIDIGQLFCIKTLMLLCNYEHQSMFGEDWFEALACMTQQASVSKDPAELLRSTIAINFTRQAL